MSGIQVTAADIAALKEQGDLLEFLSVLTSPPATAAPPSATTGSAYGAPHRPGAWPAGTRPAGPNTCSPDCDCALDHHLRPTTAAEAA